jgi:hypothetical protein
MSARFDAAASTLFVSAENRAAPSAPEVTNRRRFKTEFLSLAMSLSRSVYRMWYSVTLSNRSGVAVT